MAAKTAALVTGITVGGYFLIKAITPDKEEIMKRLPADLISEKNMKQVEERNQEIFDALQKSMKSNDPIWKIPELKSERIAREHKDTLTESS